MWANGLAAQVWFRDINCPTALNDKVNDYQPVTHDGAKFWSEWVSVSLDYPLPSRNWYRAQPYSTILSDNGGLRWHDARIQVHCYEERTIYYERFHYHQVNSSGRTEIVQCTTGSSPDPFLNDPSGTAYDPYAASDLADATSSDCTGGAGGSTGRSCSSAYVIIEVSHDGGLTWQTYWEGWSTVCS